MTDAPNSVSEFGRRKPHPRRTPPEPPTKVGGLRGDILFESKEYPLALPKKDSGGVCVVTSSLSLAAAQGAPAHSFRCSSFSHRKRCTGLRWEPCNFPPRPSLKRPKEGLRPFLWKLSRRVRGSSKGRALRCALAGDVGMGVGRESFPQLPGQRSERGKSSWSNSVFAR